MKEYISTLLYLTLCVGLLACNSSQQPKQIITELNDTQVLKQWSIPLDSLPGIMNLYPLSIGNEFDESVVIVCVDPTTNQCHHYLLNFSDSIEIVRLTQDPIDLYSYFINRNEYLSTAPSGESIQRISVSKRNRETIQLTEDNFSPLFNAPLVNNGKVYKQVKDYSYKMKLAEQNESFFKNAHPIMVINNNWQIDKYIGTYPPDYIEKKVYGYHLFPFLVEGKSDLFYSFPGSKYVGSISTQNGNSVFSEFASTYDVDYQPMDTADYMQMSKAIQFQDTVSRYIQIGYSPDKDKIARIYFRNNPFVFNGMHFNGSIVVGTAENGVEMEYLFYNEEFKKLRILLLKQGLLMLDYSLTGDKETLIDLTLLNIYDY